jgi:hypothetical protein
MLDDTKAANWKREAQEVILQAFDTDNRAYRLAGIILALIRDREDLLHYISRSQAN